MGRGADDEDAEGGTVFVEALSFAEKSRLES